MDTDEDGAPLSLKQQARRAKELAEKRARDAAKAQREATVKQIKTDKMVREKDENWTTTNGVTKGGKDVGTFRDKVSGSRGGGAALFMAPLTRVLALALALAAQFGEDQGG